MVESISKDVKGFAKLEKELRLFDRNYNGFFYWQHIRFFVCESLFGNRSSNENKEKREIKKKSFVNKLNEILIGLFISLKQEMRLLINSNYDLIIFRELIIHDRFFDSWTLPKDIKVLDCRTMPYKKGDKKGLFFLEWPRLVSDYENKFRKKLKIYKLDIKEKKYLTELEQRLNKEYGQSITADEMEQIILNYAIVDKHYSRYYDRLLRKVKCNAVTCTCYYANWFFPLHKVAMKKGIPVIEIQHGVINNHEEYWFEDDRGINNYTPDYLLTFGEIHNEWIKLIKGKRAIAIGYPFQEMCIQSLSNLLPDEKEIVIYPDSDPRFEDTICKFIDKISTKGYHVIIKIHPIEANNVAMWYPLLSQNKNAEIVTSQKEGIYYWLKRAKHHVMASTTVGLEAVVFDHTNICIATHIPHDQVQCLLDWGIARGFETDDELQKLVLNPIDMNPKNIEQVRKKLWSDNASENMTFFFERLKLNGWKV